MILRLKFVLIALLGSLPLAGVLRAQAMYLSFTGGSTSATGGYNFTNNDSVTFPAGYAGAGATFSGTNSLSATSSPVVGSFTTSFWMNTTTAKNRGTQWYSGAGLVDHEEPGRTNDWGLSLLDRKVAFGIGSPENDVTVLSSTSVTTGNWYFVTAVWEQSTRAMSLYINGSLEATATSWTTNNRADTSSNLLYIGRDYADGASSFYVGQLDEISIYPSAFNASAVQSLYASSVPEPAIAGLSFGVVALAVVGWARRQRRATIEPLTKPTKAVLSC